MYILSNRLILALFIGLALPAAYADEIPAALRYKASFENIEAGELQVNISTEPGRYVVDTEDELSAIAQLFTRERRTQTVFSRADGRVTLLRAHEQFIGDDEKREMTIDAERAEAVLFDGQRTALPPMHVAVVPTFPLILMNTPLEQLGDHPVVEIDGRKLRRYHYQMPMRAPLPTVPDTDTWKVVRERQDKPGTVTYYLAVEGPPVPLLIEIENSQGRISRLELIANE